MKTTLRKRTFSIPYHIAKELPEYEIVGDFRDETHEAIFAIGVTRPIGYVNIETGEKVSASVYENGVHGFHGGGVSGLRI